MRHTKRNGANKKNTAKMVLRACQTINQEGSITQLKPNLQKNYEKSLIDTIRKIVKEEFKEHKTKMSKMIRKNLQNINERLDNYLKK